MRFPHIAAVAVLALPALADEPLHSDFGLEPHPWMPHAEHELLRPADGPSGDTAPRSNGRDPLDRPDLTVYGYWPYWGDPLDTVPVDHLTHLAVFSVNLTSTGALSDTHRWHTYGPQALALARPFGVKVHLTVTCFSDAVMGAVLPYEAKRRTTIDELVELVDAYGADGVNVDFEGLDVELKQDFVRFVEELKARTDEVYVAMPAIDWSGSYDYDLLALASDGLFIMGYGYHWSGGNPGPVAPLYGGNPWGAYSLEWTVDDYRTWGAPNPSLVLGLPLYGRIWPTEDRSVPGSATGTGDASVYSSAVVKGETYGRRWDGTTRTPYAFPSNTEQLWYDDATSLALKVHYAAEENLQGMGFWALTYEDADPTLWTIVDELTHRDVEVDSVFPGDAGTINRVTLSEVTPGNRVDLYAALRTGRADLANCSIDLSLARTHLLGSGIADESGQAIIEVNVPTELAGRIIHVQAVEPADCETSEVVSFRLR